MELRERERKVDLNSMSTDQVDEISAQLGDKVREICDEAVAKANRLLNIYGMSAKMQIVLDHPDLKKESKVQEAPKKKRGRPKKATQSLL